MWNQELYNTFGPPTRGGGSSRGRGRGGGRGGPSNTHGAKREWQARNGENRHSHTWSQSSPLRGNHSFNSPRGNGRGGGGRGRGGNFNGRPFQSQQNASVNSNHNPFAPKQDNTHLQIPFRNKRARGGTFNNGAAYGNHLGDHSVQDSFQNSPHRGYKTGQYTSHGGGGRGKSPAPYNPFHHPSAAAVTDFDIYDADDSSSEDNSNPILAVTTQKRMQLPTANPLTQVRTPLDKILLHLIKNTPQYTSTVRRFMNGYTGKEDLEFWMNTLGVEYMDWNVLREADVTKLVLPPGWGCVPPDRIAQSGSNYSLTYGSSASGQSSSRPMEAWRMERSGGVVMPTASLIPAGSDRPAARSLFPSLVPGQYSLLPASGGQAQGILPNQDPDHPGTQKAFNWRNVNQIPPASGWRFGS
ncbi:hypothetical protein BDZ91DRAFT_790827 [Kalaharituber pfeilii]|nr:hypothetical protein BDZ91DRAFT_790827 [Kalaharituber pfeilii]